MIKIEQTDIKNLSDDEYETEALFVEMDECRSCNSHPGKPCKKHEYNELDDKYIKLSKIKDVAQDFLRYAVSEANCRDSHGERIQAKSMLFVIREFRERFDLLLEQTKN